MSDASTLEVVLAFVGVCVTQAVAWADVRRRSLRTDGNIEVASKKADTAASAAATAAKHAEPVSNGFTEDMRAGLKWIREDQQQAREERKEDRAVTLETLRLISQHLGDHAKSDILHKSMTESQTQSQTHSVEL